MKLTVLEFRDGYQAIFLEKDRQHCFIVRPGERITNITSPLIDREECRRLKCTFSQWQKRWAK